MGQVAKDIEEMIEPVIVSMGYELLGIEYIPGKRASTLRLYIDKEAGISLDDCSAVSHQVSGVLDVEDALSENYNLEVSSPGLDRPLFKLAHFNTFLGRNVKLKLRIPLGNRRKFKGVIKAVEGSDIILVCDDEEFKMKFDLIEKANLIPEI